MTLYITEAVLGLWILVSPWLLGFSGISLAKWNAVIMGLLLILLNIWTIIEKKKVGGENNKQNG